MGRTKLERTSFSHFGAPSYTVVDIEKGILGRVGGENTCSSVKKKGAACSYLQCTICPIKLHLEKAKYFKKWQY